jgi:uncharacterized membrane protein
VRRAAVFAIAGLLLGAGIHIAIVLLVPLFAVNDAWASAAALGPDGEFHVLSQPPPGASPAVRDPHLMEAVCRFILSDGPVRILATLPDGFWSLALFDRRGRNIYNINDRAADPTRLDLIVMTPDELAAMGEARLDALQNTVIASLAIDGGMAVIRVFLPDEASLPAVAAALAAADCNASL